MLLHLLCYGNNQTTLWLLLLLLAAAPQAQPGRLQGDTTVAAPLVGVNAAAGAMRVLEMHRAVGAVIRCTEAPSECQAAAGRTAAALLWLLGFYWQQPGGDAFGAVYALQQQTCCRSCGVLLVAAVAIAGTICSTELCWG